MISTGRQLDDRKAFLHNVFVARLQQSAQFVRSFEIETDPNSSYHLFFASNNVTGLEKMKEAMWAVDPVMGTRYSDSTAPGQTVLFGADMDRAVLESALRSEFGDRWFSIDAALRFTLVRTPFLARHLRSDTLKSLEDQDKIEIKRGGAGRSFTYPAGTRLRFKA